MYFLSSLSTLAFSALALVAAAPAPDADADLTRHRRATVFNSTVTFNAPGQGPVQTWYQVFGDLSSKKTPLVVLHGGPGVVHDYLLSIADINAKHDIPVVFYDQLGSGHSTHLRDRLGDTAFWTEDLFIAQLENLLDHLKITDNFSLLGHSWGGMLGARFATSHPAGLKQLVLADTPASMPLWVEAANRLRKTLPQDVQDILDKHEADGTTDSPEYEDAVNVFYGNFVIRLDPMPEEIAATFAALADDQTVYLTMNGPSEFFVNGSLQNWTIIDDIPKINVPTLMLNSQFDEAQDSVMQPYFDALPKTQWVTFYNASHMPQYEQRTKYMQVLGKFLTRGLGPREHTHV